MHQVCTKIVTATAETRIQFDWVLLKHSTGTLVV